MRRLVILGLLALGLLQMTADLLDLPLLRGAAAATGASPAPKVFSSVRGLETFSTRFRVEYTDESGALQRVQLSPEKYALLAGPYNRRNAYGAVLAYGPVLREDERTRALFESVARHALCDDAPLLRELGLEPGARQERVRVILEPRAGTAPEVELSIEVNCA